jgi:hypothetical protein
LAHKQRQLSAAHGDDIAPVTFNNQGCIDTYDHGHSVSAGPGACNRGPASLPAEKEAPKVAKATATATEEGEARVAAKEAKEVAAAKEEVAAKESGGKPKAAKKSESEASAEPAKASLLLLEKDDPIEPVTFKDSNECTQTYDHGHSVSGVPDVVCGPGSKEKAIAVDAAKKGK